MVPIKLFLLIFFDVLLYFTGCGLGNKGKHIVALIHFFAVLSLLIMLCRELEGIFKNIYIFIFYVAPQSSPHYWHENTYTYAISLYLNITRNKRKTKLDAINQCMKS